MKSLALAGSSPRSCRARMALVRGAAAISAAHDDRRSERRRRSTLGGVAMAEDGTGGIVYRKRVDGRAHVFAAQFVNGALAGAAAHRHRPELRLLLAARSAPATAAGWSSRGCRSSASARDRLFSASLDPGASRFQAPVPIDLNVGEAVAHLPVARDEPRAAPPTSPTACWPGRRRATRTRRPATSAPRRASRATTARCGRCSAQPADRNQAAPVATPTAGELAEGRHRRDRQRDRRLPGARRRLRRPRLGTAHVRLDARHPAARQPAGVRRRAAARPGRRVLARRDRLRRRARSRCASSPAPGLGAQRAARVREHDPRGVQRRRRPVRRRAARGRDRRRAGSPARPAPPTSA